MSRIFDERPMQVTRSLVRVCGGTLEALLAQQLNYWLPHATKEHGGRPWVYKTYQEWGDEIGVSAKSARTALDKLRRDGWVQAMQNPQDPRDRTLWWWVDVEAIRAADDPAGAPSARPGSSGADSGGQAADPGIQAADSGSSSTGATEPEAKSTTKRTTESASEPATLLPAEPARKPITYKGRTVPRPVADDALHLLGVFNEATKGKVGAFGGNGRQSESLTRIVGALMDRPGESRETWERGIRATVANPPGWVEGRLTIGHLFGPRAADHTLSRAAASQNPVKRVASDGQADEQGWDRRDF